MQHKRSPFADQLCRMHILCAFLVTWLAGLSSSHAQTPHISELQRRIASTTQPQQALAFSLALLNEHESLQKDSVLPTALRTFRLAQLLGDKRAEGYAYLGMANAALREGQARRADSLLSAVMPRYAGGRISLPLDFDLRFAQVSVLASSTDYEAAVAGLLAILGDAEAAGYIPAQARALNELGVISYNRDQLDQAIGYYRRVLALGTAHADAGRAQAYAFINLAQVYAWREQYDSALHYIALAKPLCERMQNLYYLANAWLIESNVYKWSGRMREAEQAMQEMVALRTRTEGRLSFSNEQLGLANLYVYTKAYDRAIATYKDGLATAEKLKREGVPMVAELELHYYEGLAKSYKDLGDRDAYEATLQTVVALKDSVAAQASAQAIAEMQTKYEVQKTEAALLAQRLDLAQKNALFYGSLGLLVAGAVIAWLIFRSYRRRSRMRIRLMQEEESRRAATAVRDAEEAERKRIAADLHDNLGAYAAAIASNIDSLAPKSSEKEIGLPNTALQQLRANARGMVSQLSDTIWVLNKDALPLTAISDRLKVFLQRIGSSHPSVRIEVVEDLPHDPVLSPLQAFHLFRILQEAVNNAVRHSGGSQITVLLRSDEGGNYSASVMDDGRGMASTNAEGTGGNGLHNMQARGAAGGWRVEWLPVKPHGTEVRIAATSN